MADHDAEEHQIGTMDIGDHQKTFAGFVRFMTWAGILSVVVLVFLALSNA